MAKSKSKLIGKRALITKSGSKADGHWGYITEVEDGIFSIAGGTLSEWSQTFNRCEFVIPKDQSQFDDDETFVIKVPYVIELSKGDDRLVDATSVRDALKHIPFVPIPSDLEDITIRVYKQ